MNSSGFDRDSGSDKGDSAYVEPEGEFDWDSAQQGNKKNLTSSPLITLTPASCAFALDVFNPLQ